MIVKYSLRMRYPIKQVDSLIESYQLNPKYLHKYIQTKENHPFIIVSLIMVINLATDLKALLILIRDLHLFKYKMEWLEVQSAMVLVLKIVYNNVNMLQVVEFLITLKLNKKMLKVLICQIRLKVYLWYLEARDLQLDLLIILIKINSCTL